jgi:hypothetical protein
MSDNNTSLARRGIFGELLAAHPSAGAIEARRKALVLAAERIGWDLQHIEIDAARGTARVEARRDNRLVYLHIAPRGRATVERFERGYVTERAGRRGDRYMSRRIEDEFLGRSSHVDPREALRDFAEYLVANGNGRALAHDIGDALGLPAVTA